MTDHMDWNSYLGHHRQRQWFQNAIRHHRLASTFLLVGAEGIGKRTFARLLAKTMLCTEVDPVEFAPCNRCESCAQIDASTHPDLIQIEREPERTALTMEQLVGREENRMREGLCYEIRMKPYSGKRKIAIVDDADTIATEGANALLKTLEEPPPGSLIFLISTSLQRQLPTIRSRCQIVRFIPLSESEVAQLVLRQGIVDSEAAAIELARQSDGSLSKAALWNDKLLYEFHDKLIAQLCSRPIDFPVLSKSIVDHIAACGTEGQPRRDRLKVLIDFALQFYRHVMRVQCGVVGEDDRLPEHLRRLSPEAIAAVIRRCLQAREQIDRMLSPAPLVESWCTDLAVLARA